MRRLDRLQIRWRLALTSAGLTFAILLLFAVIIGLFTARQVRSSFDDDLRLTAVDLSERVHTSSVMNSLSLNLVGDDVVRRAVTGDAAVRIVSTDPQCGQGILGARMVSASAIGPRGAGCGGAMPAAASLRFPSVVIQSVVQAGLSCVRTMTSS